MKAQHNSLVKIILFVIFIPFLSSCAQERKSESAADMTAADMAAAPVSDKSEEGDSKEVTTWKRSGAVPNTPKLFVGDKEELTLKGTQMTVQVHGFRARVLLDCYYYNDKDFNAEGTFKLKLPSDASPYYFAFGESVILDKTKEDEDDFTIPFLKYKKEIDLSNKGLKEAREETWTEVKEARIVPKEKAAFAYRQTASAKVDPALMEWSGPDIFNCRVFPLQPNKLHRIVIGYDVNLLETETGRVMVLNVPNTGGKVIVDLDIASVGGVKPIVEPAMKFSNEGDRIRIHEENPYADEIKIIYKGNKPLLLSDEDPNGQKFIASSFTVDLPEGVAVKTNENAILMMDVSLSSNPDKFNVWLKMAEAVLKNNQSEIKKFNVLFFNVEQFWWKETFVDNSNENIESFLKYANELSLEGATDPGAALDKVSSFLNSAQSASNIFLLSDGAVTWGEDDLFQLSEKIKKGNSIYAYKTGMEGTDLRLLEHLTQSTGGKLFSVLNENEIGKASKAFGKTSWKIERMQMQNVSDLLIAGRPQYLFSGQSIILAGRGEAGKNSQLILDLSQGDVKKQLTVKFQHEMKSSLTSRIYGQIATTQLEKFSYLTEKYSQAYSSYFKVPGQTCSFLMLESEEDYKRFNIHEENDLFVVKSVEVSKLIDETVESMSKLLVNQKENFKNWAHRLSEMPGMEITLPTSFDLLIDRIPEASFKSLQCSMNCKMRKISEIKKSTINELNEAEPDYDIVTSEAMKRKEMHGADDGMKLLSSLIEKNPGDGVLIRDVGFSAMEWGMDAFACSLFKKIVKSKPYEPQTYHALAQVYSKMGNPDLAILYYEICLAGKWDQRFGDFNTIVAIDYMCLLNQIERKEMKVSFPEYIKDRKISLENEFSLGKSDLSIVIMWNTDNTDIDLHVTEPSGEECFYSHPKTKSGGEITKDVTQGYGPEMYTLDGLESGEYLVRAHYYSRDRSRASVRTKIYASIYKNRGKSNEKILRKTITLSDSKEFQDLIELSEDSF